MLLLNYMTAYVTKRPEFGDADYCYGGMSSLTDAVIAFPARFCSETHQLVQEFLAKEVTVLPVEDRTTFHAHNTQPTQT